MHLDEYTRYDATGLAELVRTRQAAVCGAGMCDLISLSGTADVGVGMMELIYGGLPWTDPAVLRAQSPYDHATKVKTPTLVLHAVNDERSPVGQAEQWLTALQDRGLETELVLYPKADHLFLCAGRPSHRFDYSQRTTSPLNGGSCGMGRSRVCRTTCRCSGGSGLSCRPSPSPEVQGLSLATTAGFCAGSARITRSPWTGRSRWRRRTSRPRWWRTSSSRGGCGQSSSREVPRPRFRTR